jgi:hypothetical protein
MAFRFPAWTAYPVDKGARRLEAHGGVDDVSAFF